MAIINLLDTFRVDDSHRSYELHCNTCGWVTFGLDASDIRPEIDGHEHLPLDAVIVAGRAVSL